MLNQLLILSCTDNFTSCSILNEMYHKICKDCITLKDRFEGLPLHTACGYGNIEVVRQLVQWQGNELETTSKFVDLYTFTPARESRKDLYEVRIVYTAVMPSMIDFFI